MIILAINNILTSTGVDYKGLNIDLFVANSQSYDLSGYGRVVLKTTENVNVNNLHEDIRVIDENEYEETVAYDIENNMTPEQKQIRTLEQQLEVQNGAIAELTNLLLVMSTPQ